MIENLSAWTVVIKEMKQDGNYMLLSSIESCIALVE